MRDFVLLHLCAKCAHVVVFRFNYFDRLVLKNVVDKSNRRAVAGDGFTFVAFYLRASPVVQAPACFSPLKSATISSSAPESFKQLSPQATTMQSAFVKSATDTCPTIQVPATKLYVSQHVAHRRACSSTTARQDPRIVPPFSKRALNDAIRSIERVMKVPCASPVQATAHHRDPRSAKATLLPWSGLPSWRWIWSCPSANNRRAALPCACCFVYFLIALDVMLRCFIADLAAHQKDPRGELCFVPPR